MTTIKEKVLDPNGNGPYPQTPPYLAYVKATDVLSKLQTELLHAKMERDIAQKRVSGLELDIATQHHVVTVLGAVEVP